MKLSQVHLLVRSPHVQAVVLSWRSEREAQEALLLFALPFHISMSEERIDPRICQHFFVEQVNCGVHSRLTA